MSATPLLPLVLDVAGVPVLVVGGGAVGRRRADRLIRCRARVRVVDPKPVVIEGCDCVTREYQASDLDGARLVFACADADTNRRVLADARGRGIWAISATTDGAASAHLPAATTHPGVTICVSAPGAGPGLALSLLRQLEGHLDPAYLEWAGVLAEVRPLVRRRVRNSLTRRELLRRFGDESWLPAVRERGAVAVRDELLRLLDRAAGG